jgi:peroxiredoxin
VFEVNLDFRKNWLSLFLIAIAILMGIEIVYLMLENRRMRSIITNPKQYYQVLEQDDKVPPFTAQDLDGNTISLQYSPDRPHTLLLWFSPTCRACEDNLYFWNDLHRDFDSDHMLLLGMCTDDPADVRTVVAEYGLNFPVVCLDDPSLVDAYKGNVLPQTVLISPRGTIREVWPGPLGEKQRGSIITVLSQLDTLTGKGGDVR